MRVVSRPSADHDGTTNITFAAVIGNGDFGSPNSAPVDQGHGGSTASSSQGDSHSATQERLTTKAIDSTSFNVTYFHCGAGSVWNRIDTRSNTLDEGFDSCRLCKDGVEGEIKVRELDHGLRFLLS